MEDRTRNGGYVANRAANAAASAAVAAALEGGREEIRGRLSTEGDIPELGLQGKDEKGAEVCRWFVIDLLYLLGMRYQEIIRDFIHKSA